ncbi:hypothetical protein NECAME_17520, partial [Necator americanus]
DRAGQVGARGAARYGPRRAGSRGRRAQRTVRAPRGTAPDPFGHHRHRAPHTRRGVDRGRHQYERRARQGHPPPRSACDPRRIGAGSPRAAAVGDQDRSGVSRHHGRDSGGPRHLSAAFDRRRRASHVRATASRGGHARHAHSRGRRPALHRRAAVLRSGRANGDLRSRATHVARSERPPRGRARQSGGRAARHAHAGAGAQEPARM